MIASCQNPSTKFQANAKFFRAIFSIHRSPPPLSREPLVQEGEDFADVELHVLEIEVLLVIFLHLKEIVKLEIQFQQASRST